MVVHEEGEIMQTEQDPTMELSKVSMDLTMLHCPLCLRPLTPPVYECKGGHLACADCRVERPGNQRRCQKCERGGGFDVRNTAVDSVLSSVRVECPHEGCGLYVTYHKLADHQRVSARALQMPRSRLRLRRPAAGALPPHQHRASHAHAQDPRQGAPAASATVGATALSIRRGGQPRIFLGPRRARHWRAYCRVGRLHQSGASPLPHYVAKLWANGPSEEPKGTTDAVKVEMEVTSSKDPDNIDVQELTFLTVLPKLLAGAKLVSLHIQIDKLTS
ncbi:hypothetical protein VPH35_072144 [Triticum aestivum]